MPVARLSTDLIPAAERFDWWCDLVWQDVARTIITSDHAAEFQAGAETADLGLVKVTAMHFAPIRSLRTRTLIRQSDPEVYELALITGDPMWLSQRRNDTAARAGDLLLWDTSQPFDGGVCGDHAEAIIVHLPRSALSLPPDRIDRLVAQRMPATSGMGAILAAFLTEVLGQAHACRPQDLNTLGTVTLDLASAYLAQRVDAAERLSPETRRQVLTARITAFIDRNLADPDLNPAVIAAQHHMSLRSLHLLFQTSGESVAATIRRRRLERCRRDLADPRLRHRTIGETAARWGYHRPADFSRAFRGAYGVSPSEVRARAWEANDARAPR
ncbi:helix-turn-helix domain-containing protein [Streptomyces melanogenes]|uniref:Helix-turn-helix domain-containing protein n=1 Tax=Streptomyces melanogenes TaxID=67326 RepID=A0ABZ1XSH7_9ACTN|nr:helix-turn-helix domain-containing protein [Streptomyces melanogenes]